MVNRKLLNSELKLTLLKKFEKKIVNIFILVFFKRKIMKMTICKKGMKNHSKRGQTFLRFKKNTFKYFES